MDFAKLQGDGTDVESNITQSKAYAKPYITSIRTSQGHSNPTYESSPTHTPGEKQMKKSLYSLNITNSSESIHSFPVRGKAAHMPEPQQSLSQESIHIVDTTTPSTMSTFKPSPSPTSKRRQIVVTDNRTKSSGSSTDERPITGILVDARHMSDHSANGRPVSGSLDKGRPLPDASLVGRPRVYENKTQSVKTREESPFDLRPGAHQESVVAIAPDTKKQAVKEAPTVHKSTINVSPESTTSHKSVINVTEDGSSITTGGSDNGEIPLSKCDPEGSHRTILTINKGIRENGISSDSDVEGSHRTVLSVTEDQDDLQTNMGPVESTRL